MDKAGLQTEYERFFDRESVQRGLFFLFLALGVFARVYKFGAVPAGLNQDEAFAGYEAWSLLNYGIDTAGYHNPVYLTAWGSGMNALETYLMMPFIALFGLEVWVIRLPQLIVSCLSLYVSYLLVKRTVNARAALTALLMLAVCPWHIIMSRWGLESNLAPGFLLFGLYFFVLGTEKPRYLMLSALMYGLSLYTYATIWVYVPFIILVQLVYCMVYKKIRFNRYLVFSGLILALFAAPLLLFLAVNYGYIDEIRTSFFSVPKLLYMRSGEISLDEKRRKLELCGMLFIEQNDGEIWNSPSKYGLFYYISMPFALFGLIFLISRFIKCTKRREFCPDALIAIQFIVCLPQLILVKINATKVNMLLLPLVLLIALGAYYLSTVSRRQLLAALAAVYLVLFAGFEHYYFTEYDLETREHFSYGLSEALSFAEDKGEKIYINETEFYTKVLFYTQTPVDTFRDTVQYLYYPSSYLHAMSFDRYYFWADPYQPEDDAVYILAKDADLGKLPENGFKTKAFGEYLVAYKD